MAASWRTGWPYSTLSGLSARHYRIPLIKFNDDVNTGFSSEIQDFYPRS